MPLLTTTCRGDLYCRRTIGFAAIVLSTILSFSPGAHAQSSSSHGMIDLKLDDYLRRVLERNETIQQRLLEVELNRRKARSEYGAFEPELFGSFTREANNRQNTVEQERTLASTNGLFLEHNNIYEGGIETLVPSGGRVRLGYTLRDLRNNLQTQPYFLTRLATNGEYQSFFGFTITQPLLKNAWFPATLAGLRIAALESDIAFQDYRRQLMIIISTAEASYWNLYMAQEQVRFFEDSVATAEKILNDNRARQQAGKSAELEVLEAEAGLALRRSKLSEAEQKRYEAANRVITLYSETILSTNRLVRAVDRPLVSDRALSFFEIWKTAYELNPDYLIQRRKILQDYVRVGYARNQRLPQLDMKGSYGLNGLADTPAGSWDDVERGGFPSWSVGLELRIPLAGGIKGRNDLAAAKLHSKESLLALQEVETQIANSLDTALHKITSARDSAQNYQTVLNFNQNLLDSALARFEVGRLESRKVFDIEADLFDARNSQLEALVNYQRGLLELDLLEGSILQRRHLDLSQKQLQAKTAELISRGKLKEDQYQQFVKEMQWEYQKLKPVPQQDAAGLEQAREKLRQRLEQMSPHTNRPPDRAGANADDEVLRALRKRMEEDKP